MMQREAKKTNTVTYANTKCPKSGGCRVIRDRYKEKVKNDVKESLQDSLPTMLTATLVQDFQSPTAASTLTGPQEPKTMIFSK